MSHTCESTVMAQDLKHDVKVCIGVVGGRPVVSQSREAKLGIISGLVGGDTWLCMCKG